MFKEGGKKPEVTSEEPLMQKTSAMSNTHTPSIRQLLVDPRAYGNIHERKAFLQDTVKLALCCTPGYTFCSLCRQLARLCFDVGDRNDGIYSLIESHSVMLRRKIEMKYHEDTRKSPDDGSIINKRYVEFNRSIGDGYQSILNRLQEMSKEWTIIQLSCGADSVWRFGGPNAEKWTPLVHVVRMECGTQPEFLPLHFEVHPPPEAAEFVILKEIQQMRKHNQTNHLTTDRTAFWETRKKVDMILKNIIDFINTQWLGCISPLFTGQLRENKLKNTIKKRVDKIILNVVNDWGIVLSDENYCLLVKAAETINCMSDAVLMSIIGRAVNTHLGSPLVKKILKEFLSIKKEFGDKLSTVKRNPVILIVDEKLECVPFECLNTLKGHPVTRVPSLHILHGLYSVHKSSIEDGLKIVNSNSGFYIINPDKDLKAMEDRMSKFLVGRVPCWKGLVGEKLSGQKWCEVVGEKEIFVYMGHGSGSQYWNVHQIDGGIRSLSLLFGCRSAGYNVMHGNVEIDTSLQAYQAAACPCIVGMLWNVTDKDTDLVAQAILDLCLPKFYEQTETGDEITKKRGTRKALTSADSSKQVQCAILPPSEPEVARAVVQGRKSAYMLLTQAAVVLRGLPVRIK